MCLAAMRMVGINRVVYAYSNQDAAPFGLSTEKIAHVLRTGENEVQMDEALRAESKKPLEKMLDLAK